IDPPALPLLLGASARSFAFPSRCRLAALIDIEPPPTSSALPPFTSRPHAPKSIDDPLWIGMTAVTVHVQGAVVPVQVHWDAFPGPQTSLNVVGGSVVVVVGTLTVVVVAYAVEPARRAPSRARDVSRMRDLEGVG